MFIYGQHSTTIITETEARLIQAESSLSCLMDHGHLLFVVNAPNYMLLNPEKAFESRYVAVTEIRNIGEQLHYVYFLDRSEVLPPIDDTQGYFGCSDMAYEHVKSLINEKDPNFGIYDIAAKEVELVYDENGKCLNYDEFNKSPCIGLFSFHPAQGNNYIEFDVVLFRIADAKYIPSSKRKEALPVRVKTLSEKKTLPPLIDANKRRFASDVVAESRSIRCTSQGLCVDYELRDSREVAHMFRPGDMVEAELKLMNLAGSFDYVWVLCHLRRKDGEYFLQGYENYPVSDLKIRIRTCDSYEKRLTIHNIRLAVRDLMHDITLPFKRWYERYMYRRRLKRC